MSCGLSEKKRELLERTLDSLYDTMLDGANATPQQLVRATRLYVQAASIVRERPEGFRKVRSDIMSRRPTPQAELPV